MKSTILFQSSQFDRQLRNEITKFIVNFVNLKLTSETVFVKGFVKCVEKTYTQANFNIPQTLTKERRNVTSQTATQTRINTIWESKSSQISVTSNFLNDDLVDNTSF